MNPYTARAMIKDPAAFVGRTDDLRNIYTLLTAMQSCSVVGPRRIGKSSFLYHLTHPSIYSSYLPDPEPYVFTFVDLQEFAGLGPDDFFFTIVERVCRASDGRLEADPAQYGTMSGIRRFLMQTADSGLRLVLCCDEFEMLSQNPRFGVDLFTYLRGLCSNYDLAMVTSSRASLFDLCHLGNLQTSQFWNIFVERTLGLMPEDEALTLISEPFTRAGGAITEEEISFVLDLVGCHPFFIQVACYYLFEAKSVDRPLDYPAVECCFLDEARRYYTYAWEQLDEVEREALVSLVRKERIIEPTLFRRLKRNVLVDGNPESPALISAGWQRFIEHEVTKRGQPCDSSGGEPTLGKSAVRLIEGDLAFPPGLGDALTRRTLALFIGADLPREVTSLPSRADLARELARRKGLDKSLSLAEVAQRVGQAGNRWEFTAFIRDALDTAGKSPQLFHQCIVELVKTHQIETLITTAYDNLLELAFQEAGVGINRVVRGSDVNFINPDRPTLIKLYGDAQQPDTFVVTDRDHSDLLHARDKEPLVDEVRRALRSNTVFFLGYNLADPDFRFLFDQVAESRFARTAYAVWLGLPEADVRMWRDRGIVILDVDPLGILG